MGAALVLLISLAAIYLVDSAASTAPTFRPLRTKVIPPYPYLHYPSTEERPFEGGRVWLLLYGGATSRYLLFDLESGEVLGELVNAGPELFDADGNLLLCRRRISASSLPVQARLRRGIEHIANAAGSAWRTVGLTPPGGVRSSRPVGALDQEDYWALDLRTGEAIYLGHFMEHTGAGSLFYRSPDLRFALKMPTTENPPTRDTAYLIDMTTQTMRRIRLRGWPVGWWDSTTALVWSNTEGLLMVNVMTGSHAPLLGKTLISAFLDQAGLSDAAADKSGFTFSEEVSPFVSWNGQEYDVYFTRGHRRWSAEESFLLKVDRTTKELRLLSSTFKFEWSDHFDESMQNYLYSGRERGDRNDGVFLRDLNTGIDRTLVEPKGANPFSIPRFYGDRVLYVQTNELWSVQLDGTDQKRVFPP